jgi:hypothetical protein
MGSKGWLRYINLAELLDRLTGKIGANSIRRFLPDDITGLSDL